MTKPKLGLAPPAAKSQAALDAYVQDREKVAAAEPTTRLTMDLAKSLHARLAWASLVRSQQEGKKVTIADIVREFVATLPEPPSTKDQTSYSGEACNFRLSRAT